MERKPISKKIRFDVFKRDAFVCQYCGNTPPAVILEIDHIHPVSKGGENDIDNLLTACFACNRGKSNHALDVAPKTISEKAEILAEKMEQMKAFDRLIRKNRKREDMLIDEVESTFKEYYAGFCFSPTFRQSVRVFIQSIDIETACNAMIIACKRMNNRDKAIKYFCGICWKTIKESRNGTR